MDNRKTYIRILLARDKTRASDEQRWACEPCTGQEDEERIKAPWTHCGGCTPGSVFVPPVTDINGLQCTWATLCLPVWTVIGLVLSFKPITLLVDVDDVDVFTDEDIVEEFNEILLPLIELLFFVKKDLKQKLF